ncbi:MAG: fibronectin type III domain-containing protein, partial [Myxococcaceae bacterium]|nr:fibronectin type III domain-containing protein [Myxococcaceae bacterium]
TGRTLTVGPARCGEAVTVNYQVTPQGLCDDLELWVTTASNCSGGRQSSDLLIDSLTREQFLSAPTGSRQFNLSALPSFGADAGSSCGTAGVTQTFRVCGTSTAPGITQICQSNENDVATRATPLELVYDAEPPDAPTITSVEPLDQELRVTVDAESNVGVRVEQRIAGTTDWTVVRTLGTDVRTLQITNLQNGTSYEVQAIAIDAAGNESAASGIASGTPIQTLGFWGAYKEAGGQQVGGCTATGAMLTPLGILAVLFLRRRRS